jgi:hypothetical protein
MIARQPTKTILKRSACGHGIINTQEEAYIHSQATGKDYCDLVCLSDMEGLEYSSERREGIKEMYEVVSYG